MPKLEIDQIALCPPDPVAALELLQEMGIDNWVHDNVTARGQVLGNKAENVANLDFNYTALEKARELEVLHYTQGPNWMAVTSPRVSHFGMHCTEAQVTVWKEFFAARRITIVQEVFTHEHTNPVIAGTRWYHYIIFGTHAILGVDLKFIVRREQPGSL